MPVTPSNISQPQQIMQQNIQRDLINQGVLAGRMGTPNAYFPGTMLQAQGFRRYLYASTVRRNDATTTI